MKLFLTKTECNDLKQFLEEETMLHPENKKCEMHTKAIKNCNECETINKVKSLEDQELYKTISENMKAEKEGENFRLVQKMVFTKPEAELFNPENSNYEEAVKSSKSMLFKLKRMGDEKMKEYDSQIKKSIKDGCFNRSSTSWRISLVFVTFEKLFKNFRTIRNLRRSLDAVLKAAIFSDTLERLRGSGITM